MKIRICLVTYTTKNTIISPNFLVWKLGDITAFFAVLKIIFKLIQLILNVFIPQGMIKTPGRLKLLH